MTTSPTVSSNLDRLEPATRALVGLAAAIASGNAENLEAACRAVLGDEAPHVWVEELLLQSVLMVGWPRALIAADAWRRISGQAPGGVEDGGDYRRHGDWEERGEAVCRVIYGRNYDRLRDNVRALHPTLERWMLIDGYGRTIGRPGLDLARRELCIVAQVAVQGAERQLHSHLRGALNAGASAAAVEQALAIAAPHSTEQARGVAAALWERVRA